MNEGFVKKSQIGTIIFIPFVDKLFDNVWAVGERWLRKKDKKFLDKLEKFKSLDKKDFEPIYYCYECQRLEDGCHRSWTMKNKGYTGYETFVGRVCWTKMDKLHTRLVEKIKEHKLSQKDILWTVACREKKWPVIRNIDFSGKTYLDVGAQSGYSALMGWMRGATKVVGVELRKEIYDVAVEMKNQLDAKAVEFHNLNWIENKDKFGKFDIVSCMGLLHYFPADKYESILEDLCNRANQTLILELRVWPDPEYNYMEKHTQTFISVKHLEEILKNKGFKIMHHLEIPQRTPKTAGKRGLWIAERLEKK